MPYLQVENVGIGTVCQLTVRLREAEHAQPLEKPQERDALASLHMKDVSFSGDIPAPPGQGPVQPAVGDPASAGGLD